MTDLSALISNPKADPRWSRMPVRHFGAYIIADAWFELYELLLGIVIGADTPCYLS